MGTSRGAGCPRRVSPVPRDGPGTVLAGSEPDGVVQPFPTQPLAELPCEHPKMPQLPAPRPQDSRSLPHPARRPPWHWPQPLCPVPGAAPCPFTPASGFSHQDEPESSPASSPVGSSVLDAWRSSVVPVQQPVAYWQCEPGRRNIPKYRSPLLGHLRRVVAHFHQRWSWHPASAPLAWLVQCGVGRKATGGRHGEPGEAAGCTSRRESILFGPWQEHCGICWFGPRNRRRLGSGFVLKGSQHVAERIVGTC